MRPKAFVAAHDQPVYLPLFTSTLCPHLADRDRIPFRHGLFLALAALIVAAMLKLLPLLVVLTAFGIPLLFFLYLWRSDIFRDIPARAMILSSLIGIALGVVWWTWSGAQVASSYDIPLSAGFQMINVVNLGLAVSVGDSVLMLVPAAVVRMLRLPTVESLDGFVIGALGALSFTTAGTVTWLAPQFIAGLIDNYDSSRLLSEAILDGVCDPLIATAAGGTMGILLWFRPTRRTGQPSGIRVSLVLCAAITAASYLAVYMVAAGNNPHGLETLINVVLTLTALLALRCAIQLAVLHELPDEASDEPIRCIHCTATVPDMPFCSQCGGAERASSRSARRLRGEPTGLAQ
ncbi:MAG: zinc ribbon domain-containing protein [Mycobacterium sp.]|nr:zinc ribbon domain-containing protein [Mycobacterium sp.]